MPVGVNDGIFECRKLGGDCTGTHVVTGIAIENISCDDPLVWSPTVVEPPSPTNCVVAAGYTWSVGGNTCIAENIVDIPVGAGGVSNDTISDALSPGTGIVEWTCPAGSNRIANGPLSATCAVGATPPSPPPPSP